MGFGFSFIGVKMVTQDLSGALEWPRVKLIRIAFQQGRKADV